MAISWKLKSYLARKHQIYTATELRKQIVKKTGVVISLPNLCMYLNKKPKRLELETIQILCTVLKCEMNDFLTITAQETASKPVKQRKLSAKNTPQSKIALSAFPEPVDYGD